MQHYRSTRVGRSTAPSKSDIPADYTWRISTKSLILAALTVLSLGVGVANAQSFAHEMAPRHQQQQTSQR